MKELLNNEVKFDKFDYVSMVDEIVEKMGYKVSELNTDKPWGAYWCIDEKQIGEFVDDFFPTVKLEELSQEAGLSPKLLLVAPDKRLSWQYHDRRSELWSVVSGPVVVTLGKNDSEQSPAFYFSGETVEIGKGTRHRLIGGKNWGLVAEIWVHSEPGNPSNEDDIVRLADDFGR